MDKQYIDKHEAETHELPESKNAYERAARIVDQMRPVNVASMERKTGRWIDEHCSECGCYVYSGDAEKLLPSLRRKDGGGVKNEKFH